LLGLDFEPSHSPWRFNVSPRGASFFFAATQKKPFFSRRFRSASCRRAKIRYNESEASSRVADSRRFPLFSFDQIDESERR